MKRALLFLAVLSVPTLVAACSEQKPAATSGAAPAAPTTPPTTPPTAPPTTPGTAPPAPQPAPAPASSPAAADPYAKQRERWAAEIGKVDWLFDVDAALAKAKTERKALLFLHTMEN